MSDAMMADFTSRAAALSYDETLSVISVLLERLKNQFKAEEKTEISAEERALQAIFARADELHLSSNGEKWTREELYER